MHANSCIMHACVIIFQTIAFMIKANAISGTANRPRRRLDRETTPGRCSNLDYCSIGMQRVLLKVPLSQPFTCPECAGPLRAPRRGSIAGPPFVLPMLRLGVLVAAMLVSLGVGYLAGRARSAVGTAVTAASANIGANLHQAKTALGLAPEPSSPAPARPAPIFVSERAYPARLPSVDSSKPAAHLPGEARFGQVTLDCTVEAAASGPTCQVTDIRGADAFSAAAIVWLQDLAVHYGPTLRGGVPASLAHRWRVVFEDFSGTSMPSKTAGR